jgi:hypothetical protein
MAAGPHLQPVLLQEQLVTGLLVHHLPGRVRQLLDGQRQPELLGQAKAPIAESGPLTVVTAVTRED